MRSQCHKCLFRFGQLVWHSRRGGVGHAGQSHRHCLDGWNQFLGHRQFCGNQLELDGTLFYNPNVEPTPYEVQNYIQAAAEARIIGGTLYVVVPGGVGGL